MHFPIASGSQHEDIDRFTSPDIQLDEIDLFTSPDIQDELDSFSIPDIEVNVSYINALLS
jgi:hypothetical protein